MLIVYVLWISDVGMNHYVFLFPLYMPKLLQKRLGWQIFGCNMGSGHWNPCFSRPLNDWEVDAIGDLFVKLQGKAVDLEGEDKMVDELARS